MTQTDTKYSTRSVLRLQISPLLKVSAVFILFVANLSTIFGQSDIVDYFRTNTVQFGPEYLTELKRFQIEDVKGLRPYLNRPEIVYPVLVAIEQLNEQGHHIDKETLDAIQGIALSTRDKQLTEPEALKIILNEKSGSNRVDFALSILPKLGSRSLLLVMEWVCDSWNKSHLKDDARADRLVLLSLNSWQPIYESDRYITLHPVIRKILGSTPYNLEEYKRKTQNLAVNLLGDIDKLSSGSHFFLVDYLLNSETNSSIIEQNFTGLIARGPKQRAQIILWTLSDRYQDNQTAQQIITNAASTRPDLSEYLTQLENGKIDVNKGMQEPLADLSKQLYKRKSLEVEK